MTFKKQPFKTEVRDRREIVGSVAGSQVSIRDGLRRFLLDAWRK